MKIYKEIEGSDFEFWYGAVSTIKYLTGEEIDQICEDYFGEDIYPNGVAEVEINDFFWFETDEIAKYLGYEDFDELMEDRKDWE